jgi:hypothetical protein
MQDQINQDALAIEQWSILIPADIDLDGIDLQTLSMPEPDSGFL